MTPEQKQILEDAIDLCRSAMSIAARRGDDTNWAAFERKGLEVLTDYRDLDITEAHRAGFETWVRSEPFFADLEGETLDRDGDGYGYIDANVHGAWMSYLAHVPKPCKPVAPCASFTLPAVPIPAAAVAEDVVGYPSDGE